MDDWIRSGPSDSSLSHGYLVYSTPVSSSLQLYYPSWLGSCAILSLLPGCRLLHLIFWSASASIAAFCSSVIRTRLKRDRAALRAEVLTLKQQYISCKSQLIFLEDRILKNERNQQHVVAFFAKVLSNPAFVQQFLLKYAVNKELCSTVKRQRLTENEEQHVDTPLKNGKEPALATDANASAASSDGGSVPKHEPMAEWNNQEMDNIWDDVWHDLDTIPGAEMDQEDKAAARFEEFIGRPCGWVDDCPYLVEQMQFVEH